MLVGVILVAVGVIALAQRLGIVSGSVWSYSWPLILIILGLSMLWGWWARGRRHWMWGWCCGPGFPRQEEKEKR